MKHLYFLAITLTTIHSWALPPKKTENKNTVGIRYVLQYDPAQLRIPGESFPIGIMMQSSNGMVPLTKGFLNGKTGWNKYKVEVEGGSFSGGQIKLKRDSGYKKGDSISVSVYTRKWFLGGKGEWLLTQKIPYDYEDSITILTTGNIGRAPGDHIQFGIRTWFDNKAFTDKWFSRKDKPLGFVFGFDGGHLSRSKGNLKIENDPGRISNDRVRLTATLAKAPEIRDTLQIMLNYVAAYQCKIQSTGAGHNLMVAADLYFDSLINAKLLQIKVVDSMGHKTYRYRVNTSGGSITIASKGADGADGRNGMDGSTGANGTAGAVSVDVQTTTAADGTLQTTTTTNLGPGGDGSRGGNGEDGGYGDDGANGGNIVVIYTSAAASFVDLIRAVSIPGTGGSGGRGGQGGNGGIGGSGNPPGSMGLRGNDGLTRPNGFNGKKGVVTFQSK